MQKKKAALDQRYADAKKYRINLSTLEVLKAKMGRLNDLKLSSLPA